MKEGDKWKAAFRTNRGLHEPHQENSLCVEHLRHLRHLMDVASENLPLHFSSQISSCQILASIFCASHPFRIFTLNRTLPLSPLISIYFYQTTDLFIGISAVALVVEKSDIISIFKP